MGVEPGRDQDELGLEGPGQGGQELLEGPQVGAVAVAVHQGEVQGAALARAAAHGLPGPGAGVEGRLVQGGVEDPVVAAEGVLGAIAVVDVPVHDQHPLEPLDLHQVLGGDGHVVEQAEAHGPLGRGVVAGGAQQGHAVVDPAGQGRVAEVDQRAHRAEGHLIGLGRGAGVRVQGGVAALGAGDALHVALGVHQAEFVVAGRPQGKLQAFAAPRPAGHGLLQRRQPLGRLAVVAARVVLLENGVVNQSGDHAPPAGGVRIRAWAASPPGAALFRAPGGRAAPGRRTSPRSGPWDRSGPTGRRSR